MFTIVWNNGGATSQAVGGDTQGEAQEHAVLAALQCCKDAKPLRRPVAIFVTDCVHNNAGPVWLASPSYPTWQVCKFRVDGVNFAGVTP